MASSQEYLEYVLEQLNNLNNLTYKKMMGEYLLYNNGNIFGGIYDDRFLIKKNESLDYLNLKEEIPYQNAKCMYLIDPDDKELINKIIDILNS